MTAQFSNGCTRNARFWVFCGDGFVKLTLRPDQVLTWRKFARDDEGWSSVSESWTHVGAGVVLDWRIDGRDCDGRLVETGSSYCGLEDLNAVDSDRDLPARPDWQRTIENLRRDEFAEAAGY